MVFCPPFCVLSLCEKGRGRWWDACNGAAVLARILSLSNPSITHTSSAHLTTQWLVNDTQLYDVLSRVMGAGDGDGGAHSFVVRNPNVIWLRQGVLVSTFESGFLL